MILAQVAEINHVIDARLVGALVGLIMLGFLPLVKWLGGMAVASAIGKITGVETTVAEIKAAQTESLGRHNEHGRRLALTTANAEHAYNKAAQAVTRTDELTVKAAEMGRDIEHIGEKAESALQKAVLVEGGQNRLALEHGKLEGRVDRVEGDVGSARKRIHDLGDKLNRVVLQAAIKDEEG